jgi:hypothetical protein
MTQATEWVDCQRRSLYDPDGNVIGSSTSIATSASRSGDRNQPDARP